MSDGQAPVEQPGRVRVSPGEWLRSRFSDTQRYVIIWIITGIACGFAAVLFHLSIDGLFHLLFSFARSFARDDTRTFLVTLVVLPTFGGLITGIILAKFAPNAAGSGIPQTKAQFYRDFGVMNLRDALYRFIVGTISVGSGMSLGREGPTVHICSAIASKIGQGFGIAKKRVQAMVPLGMGAGIAAAFNTPMAAVFFVFEELLGDFSSKSFFGIFITVVIAAVVQRLIVGEHPAFDIELGLITTDWWMLLSIPLGFLAAFLGRIFVYSLMATRRFFKENSVLPPWIRPAVGGLGVGLVGVTVYLLTDGNLGTFGIGYRDLDSALNGRMLFLSVVVALFFGKFLASILAYGSGGSGGLFAPTLFMGGMLGASIGIIGQPVFGYESDIVGAMALLGMGSFFAAVIRCPMTSIVIIWEMTGLYSLILPLMAGNILAWLMSNRWQPVPLYDRLLLQDRISLRKMPNYTGDKDWRNLPISTIMTFNVEYVQMGRQVSEVLHDLQKRSTKHHAYPALDAESRLVRVVTHHEMEEIVKELPDAVMEDLPKKKELVVLNPETSIRDAAQTLVLEDVLQAPVVSPSDPQKVIGILTLHDIARQQNAIDDSLGRE